MMMIYYKDPETGEVYAYDDQQVADGIVKEGLVPMTPEEVEAHLNPPVPEQLPAPLPDFLEQELANPTVAEWNALCDAAGAPELKK